MIRNTTHAKVTNNAGEYAWPWNDPDLAHNWDITREPGETVITYKPNPDYTLTIGRVSLPIPDHTETADALTIQGQTGSRPVKIAAMDLNDARCALAICVMEITHA